MQQNEEADRKAGASSALEKPRRHNKSMILKPGFKTRAETSIKEIDIVEAEDYSQNYFS